MIVVHGGRGVRVREGGGNGVEETGGVRSNQAGALPRPAGYQVKESQK